MGPGLRLELKQSQQLVMTPQLQQAIRLLQLSNLELAGFLEQECERNPLLQIEGRDGEALPAERPEPDRETDGPAIAGAAELSELGAENLYGGNGEAAAGWRAAGARGRTAGRIGDDGPSDQPFEDRLAERPTLRAHLLAQLGQARAPNPVRCVAAALVEMLDEHGYLRADAAELAPRLGVDARRFAEGLSLLQTCEPTGVGARSLAECLALQLAERDRLDPAMQALLDNIELIARGDHRRLQRLARIDEEDYAEMLAELRGLDPRPCAGFTAVPAETLVPDIFVRRAAWGGWTVELNTDTLPRVLIDSRYAATVERGGAEARQFVAECRASAGWLIRSLDQRARTIVRVASEIVRHQERFFEQGVTGLRPLNLKMLAEAVGIHESTASRVTAGKYMATDRGIFELKFFFTNAVGGGVGGGVAASSVRHRIRTMVNAETADAVLSDDEIVEMLRQDGVAIARRTVAKYRKTLRIPSSVDRRRQRAVATDG